MDITTLRSRLEAHAAACRDAMVKGDRLMLPENLREELLVLWRRGERANLVNANLDGARLVGASLVNANLDGARMPNGRSGAKPETAEERKARLTLRYNQCVARAAEFRDRHPEVPVVERLDSRIYAAVTDGVGALRMETWHTCETTHCRAGWAITIAGLQGKALEDRIGAPAAGAMIYMASVGRVPNFYASTTDAMKDLRECASIEAHKS